MVSELIISGGIEKKTNIVEYSRNLKSDDQSAIVGAKFQHNWQQEMNKEK